MSNADCYAVMHRFAIVNKEWRRERINLSINLNSNPHLQPQAVHRYQKNKMSNTSCQNELVSSVPRLFLRDRVRKSGIVVQMLLHHVKRSQMRIRYLVGMALGCFLKKAWRSGQGEGSLFWPPDKQWNMVGWIITTVLKFHDWQLQHRH